MDEVKIPLSKANKKKFRELYLQYFLKEAPSNIGDETLIKAIREYESKQNPNSENGTKPEGIEVQAGKPEQPKEDAVPKEDGVIREEQSKKYFDLFGSQPTESMTIDQINNAIDVKESQLAELNNPEPVVEQQLKHDPETQVVAQHVESGEIRVLNKQTMKYLKEWKVVPEKPKEIQ